jgi:DNA repair protein RAD57
MTDLTTVLPGFDIQPYARLIPSLEKNLVTTTDLLTLDAVDIAKRAKLPLLDLKRLCNDVLQSLQKTFETAEDDVAQVSQLAQPLAQTGNQLLAAWNTISTLDDTLDHALGGGIPTGYITEITGER